MASESITLYTGASKVLQETNNFLCTYVDVPMTKQDVYLDGRIATVDAVKKMCIVSRR